MPELVLKLGDSVLQTYVFDKEVMSIGRSRDNDVVIENLSVSRNHARIRRQGARYILTDLNSANGTYVNGVRVSKTEICDNDMVTIGKHQLNFVNQAAAEDELVADAYGGDRTMLVERSPVGILCVTDGKLKGKEFQLTRFETAVGKANTNDIVLGDDWFLSRKQAIIRRHGSDFEIEDLGGFRKTKVNGRPVNQPISLKVGDRIEFGNTRCIFQISNEVSTAAQATGRIPEELGVEDSIFSSSMSSSQEIEQLAEQPAEEHDFSQGLETPLESSIQEDMVHIPPIPAAAEEQPQHEEELSPEAVALPELAPVSVEASAALPNNDNGNQSGDWSFATNQFSAQDDELQSVVLSANNADFKEDVSSPQEFDEVGYSGAPAPQEPVDNEPASPERNICEEILGGDEPPAIAEQEIMPEPAPAAQEEPSAQEPLAQPEGHPAEADQPQQEDPGSSGEQADEALAKEIALWESALQNKSPVIRKQAAKTLKKLTGKDYAY